MRRKIWKSPRAFYKSKLLKMPEYYLEKIDVMVQLFLVIGNGHYWTDCGNIGEDILSKREGGDFFKKSLAHLKNKFPDLPNDNLEELLGGFVKENVSDILREPTFVHLHTPFKADIYSELRRELKNDSSHALFFSAPDNVTKKWLFSLLEFGRFWKGMWPEIPVQTADKVLSHCKLYEEKLQCLTK